jgi:hypothetical protein
MGIAENYERIRSEVPENVTIVAAAKTRSPQEVAEAIQAGVTDIGENYVQEAEQVRQSLGRTADRVRWHMIGHLQSNKINKALHLFDMIQTVESVKKADAIDRKARAAGKVIPVYIEINIGEEEAKHGVTAGYDAVLELAAHLGTLSDVRLEGVMTMGPLTADPEQLRPYFRETRGIYERLRQRGLPGVQLNTLSMGMSDSYRVAVEEGATMIRLGTVLFGPRPYP